MPIKITDSDNITSVHTAVRLQSELGEAGEKVENMSIQIFFEVKTRLPNGKDIGQPYWDLATPLTINCKDNPELMEAMKVIQQAIGQKRYEQMTTPVPESVESLEVTLPPTNDQSSVNQP